MLLGSFKTPNFPVTLPCLKTIVFLQSDGSTSPQAAAVPGGFLRRGRAEQMTVGFGLVSAYPSGIQALRTPRDATSRARASSTAGRGPRGVSLDEKRCRDPRERTRFSPEQEPERGGGREVMVLGAAPGLPNSHCSSCISYTT